METDKQHKIRLAIHAACDDWEKHMNILIHKKFLMLQDRVDRINKKYEEKK